MPWLRHLALLVAFVAALVRSAPASAFTPARQETRVGGFEVAAQFLAGELAAASRGQHQGIGAAYDENVPGYRFAAGGATRAFGGLSRAAARTELQVAERVAGQPTDARLGPLAGRISTERLQTFATNPNAMRYLDTASGHTNVVQLVEGRLLRITVADRSRIISVGPIQRNGLFNGVANGRFVPIVE